MQCFSWLLLIAAAVMVMVTMLRWFEQATEAVQQRWWDKVILLIVAPFAVWFFPSKVAAGRPTAVPRHEPVRGFGTVPRQPKEASTGASTADGPPPGTPQEFIGMPSIPPKKKSSKSAIDPDKIAKLKQKMREQGMIDDELND